SMVVVPLSRTNRNYTAAWEKVTWDEAIRAVALQLKQIREKGKGAAIGACLENTGGYQKQYLAQFLSQLGSTNIVEYSGLRDPGAAAVAKVLMGPAAAPAYDLKNALYVLSVGTPLLEGWLSPTYVHRWFGEFRQGRRRRGKFIQAEDRLSPTAAKADEWVPLQAGSESDFLLGLAGVLVLEDLYDHEFVERHCAGFEQFRDSILSAYTLDRLKEYTGVPSVVFLRIARELASQRPSVVVAEQMDVTAGTRTMWAASCLNALLGNIGRTGGMLPQKSDHETPAGTPALSEWLSSASGTMQALLLFPGSPLQLFEGRQEIQAALEKVPFIVSFSPYLDEKSLLADWILPDCCPLEKWNDVIPDSPEGAPIHAIVAPAIEPIVDAKDVIETVHLLGARMGGDIANAVAAVNSEQILRAGVEQIFQARRGQVYDTEFSGDWIVQMEAGGWWASQQPDVPALWSHLKRKGGWWDPFYRYEDWKHIFTLPSGRFEFLPSALQSHLHSPVKNASKEQALQARVVRVYSLDHVPLQLQPFLMETADSFQRKQWDCWAEIHPETAREWKLGEGDKILVQGPKGSFIVGVLLFEGAQPGHLNIAAGPAGTPEASWVAGFGIDVYGCLTVDRDPYLRIPAGARTPVRIQKA
ncbi:MAG TPA: molybdopterin-dependent oxidoreductase, partial [Acidobacteriota bacterium]|nr:molybdopterin-dependent oxidoreductase [Acidobacteriota bacterium]